jgi:hypothetical protein
MMYVLMMRCVVRAVDLCGGRLPGPAIRPAPAVPMPATQGKSIRRILHPYIGIYVPNQARQGIATVDL